ncbi:uncharacterized protein [Miscanthus floridulus]|uniref:uncharacterized protein n=1 Tax=Miscanthus floridulus TaxID=154761 RepID=UPI00345A71BF
MGAGGSAAAPGVSVEDRWMGGGGSTAAPKGCSLALAPKKSDALQAIRVPSPNVAPILGRSGTDVAASSAGQVPPVVAPTPLVGQAGTGAEEAPSGVAEQTTAEVTPPPMLERTRLPPTLVAPSMVGAVPQVKAPASEAEVTMTTPSQEQSNIATVVSEGVAQSTPPAAQAAEPEAG